MLKNMLKLWEVACSNMYAFDGGGIINSRIESRSFTRTRNFSYMQSRLISGRAIAG